MSAKRTVLLLEWLPAAHFRSGVQKRPILVERTPVRTKNVNTVLAQDKRLGQFYLTGL